MAVGRKHLWKAALLSGTVPFDNSGMHTVVQNLLLADALGVPRVWQLPLHWGSEDEQTIERHLPAFRTERYAVLHPYPKFRYKMWNPDAWRGLIEWLASKGFQVVLTGGPDLDEQAYVEDLLQSVKRPVTNLAGRLQFRALAALLSGAGLYVGPDTATTHLAAASGVPTIALFGPSNPVKWGPWPKDWSSAPSPYERKGTQFRGNVALVQGEGHCVPCLEEGCARQVESESACLQMLRVDTVTAAIERLLSPNGR
jgi:heptosyltransferase-3